MPLSVKLNETLSHDPMVLHSAVNEISMVLLKGGSLQEQNI